jgi:ABC-2 type transport system permease protein
MTTQLLSKKNRALLAELVRTDFKVRYQGSVLGYAWSLLRPLLLFLILYLVFGRYLRLGADIPHYPIYLLLGVVLWSFFNEMTSQSLSSIVVRGDLIRKIRIPRWIIIMTSSISALVNLLLNLLVVAVFMLFSDVEPMATALWLPLILVEIYLLAVGTSLLLATLYVKYRDVSYIWEVVLQAMFYLTPIIYPLSLITNVDVQKMIMLNPMAQAIQDARYATLTHDTVTLADLHGNDPLRLVPYAVIVVLLTTGVLYFRRRAPYFAEDL